MTDLEWWKKAVFYQVYPRSFADGDGDGIGDLRGLLSKLDYLHDLGVDAVWLSPHYPSPLWDCGYDISDYENVAPEYGDLPLFKEVLDGLHQRGMRLILDLVLNHTSDQHQWFLESRSSRDNPKRDWYIWEDGKNGGLPNNWYSTFGGPAWEFDANSGQYFYHYFFKQQPDLNWRNPEVKEAMFQVVRFWLDLGVDGFRLDAIGTIYEDPNLADHTSTYTQAELYRLNRQGAAWEGEGGLRDLWEEMFHLQHDFPEVHELMRDLRRLVDQYPDRVLVGETDLVEFYGKGDDELHLVFNFPLMRTGRITPDWVRKNQRERLAGLPDSGWPGNTLGNHDSPRVFTRYADGRHDDLLVRLHLALMLTLRGTPFLYYGEEIGMTDFRLDSIGRFRDMLGVWTYETEIEVLQIPPEKALEIAALNGRDKCRTPMQWTGNPNAGFCPPGQLPWLPVNPNYAQGINVADQMKDPGSILNYYRDLLQVRRGLPALISGDYQEILAGSKELLAFTRHDPHSDQKCLVALNFSDQSQSLAHSGVTGVTKRVFSSQERGTRLQPAQDLRLAPYEVWIGVFERSK